MFSCGSLVLEINCENYAGRRWATFAKYLYGCGKQVNQVLIDDGMYHKYHQPGPRLPE